MHVLSKSKPLLISLDWKQDFFPIWLETRKILLSFSAAVGRKLYKMRSKWVFNHNSKLDQSLISNWFHHVNRICSGSHFGDTKTVLLRRFGNSRKACWIYTRKILYVCCFLNLWKVYLTTGELGYLLINLDKIVVHRTSGKFDGSIRDVVSISGKVAEFN